MLPENKIIHAVWIGDELSLLEQLTIKLYQKHKHEVHLWAYNEIKNVPKGTILRNASEILPIDSVFSFKGAPTDVLVNGGIGSFSHWSDQFQLKLLFLEGGIYSQLDVSCLRPFNFKEPIKFVTNGIVLMPFVMKFPKNDPFLMEAFETLKEKINKSTFEPNGKKEINWHLSMRIMANIYKKYPHITPDSRLNGYIELGGKKGTDTIFYKDGNVDKATCIHWSNATRHDMKNNPIEGSVYYKLLKSVDLL